MLLSHLSNAFLKFPSRPIHYPSPLIPMSRSPAIGGGRLNSWVEELLKWICSSHSLPPPDPAARRALAALSVDAAAHVLKQIAASPHIGNLSSFIVHMTNNPVSPPRIDHSLSTRESVCFSGPRSGSDVSSGGTGAGELGSPQMVALGKLEFRKAFLLLSYVGSSRFEDTVSVELIDKLKSLSMASFEEKVWGLIGRGRILESDRRKNFDWDSRKAHVYHCHVDSHGILTFKGPFLQVTRTHLQRVLGDDNILLVKFSKEDSHAKRSKQSPETLNMYHKVAKDGILVGLRRYHFFVYKDGGKEEKRKEEKSPTSSSVKCYFVRTESSWAMDMGDPYILAQKSIHEARSIFMHVHTTASLAKYMLRFSLILSKTTKLGVDLASVRIEVIEDIPCMDEKGAIVYNEDGEIMIHTDGTGFISEDLAQECPGNIFKGQIQIRIGGSGHPEILPTFRQSGVPLLIQFRLFNNGLAAKGTLLVDKRLPPKTIYIRPSMIKVDPDPHFSDSQCCNSLEIVATSNQPKRTYLSRYLIALLHYGGVPKEYFLGLLDNALDDVQNVRYNKRAALRVALRCGEMDDFVVPRMILSGISLDEPYLQYRLSILMREERNGLKGGKLPVTDCYYLMGTVDPTGTLKPNEVCIILDNGQISGNVLVYKSPGLHFGDIHVLKATYIKDMENIVGNSKYAIFFPTKGPRSLADEMANSDFDGDMYWVSRNPQLLEHFRASDPWTRPASMSKIFLPKPIQFSHRELERELFQQFLINRFESSNIIGTAADSWMIYMDRLLTLGNDCFEEKQCLLGMMIKLVNIYYDALDAAKTGLKVNISDELKPEKYPSFMERENFPSYRSTSILGMIYEKAISYQTNDLSSNEIWVLPCFTRAARPSCMELWEPRYRTYKEAMSHAMSQGKEFKDLMADEIIQKYVQMLYGGRDFEERSRNREEIFEEALAIYQITYNYAKSKRDVKKCSFAWRVGGQALCMMYAREQGRDTSILCLSSVLREVLG